MRTNPEHNKQGGARSFLSSSSRPRVVVTRTLPARALERLMPLAELVVWDQDSVVPRAWLESHLPTAQGLICLLTDRIDAALLDRAPQLSVISTMAVGTDHIDIAACTRRGIPVGHTPGVLTETTADLAFALLLAAARRIPEAVEYVKQGHWTSWSPTLLLGYDVYGATLGIVGFGRIGRAMARRAQGFSMRVLACRSTTGPARESEEHGVRFVELSTLLQESDFISLHVPLTEKTYHMIGAHELRLMKPTAILINTARGCVVDSAALYDALSQRIIAGAALDVTDPEPIPPDDPLLRLPQCLIVPHIASASVATRANMASMAVENVLAGLKGEPLPFCANPEVYASKPEEKNP